MSFSITGQMKVSTLKDRFNSEFGLTLRVYDGRSLADPDKTVSAVRKKQGSGELSVKKSMLVGNLEDKIMELYGIKTKIAGSDDSYLCDNSLTLVKARDKDQRKVEKKAAKLSSGEIIKEKGNDMNANIISGGARVSEAGILMPNSILPLINKMLSGSAMNQFEENSNIFRVAEKLKGILPDVIEDIPDDVFGELEEISNTITEEIDFKDFWKYSLIFNTINSETYDVEFPIDENIRSKFLQTSESSIEVLNVLREGLDEIDLDADSSDVEIYNALDLMFASFYLGVEMAIGYPDADGEWESIEDIDTITQWITGYGNPYGYDNYVNEVVDLLFSSEAPYIRDMFYDDFFDLLKYLYEIDMSDYRDDFDSPDWDRVAEEFEEKW